MTAAVILLRTGSLQLRRSRVVPQERGAPPDLVVLVGRRPLTGDHPGRLLASSDRLGARTCVYLDAGHAHWRSTGEMAQRLLRAGIQYAQGFSVNVANRQTTKQSYRWGRELSDLLGRRELVIDTSRNGLGPPPDAPDRDDEWCNPRRQALGQASTSRTTLPGLAALLWVKLPGESDGICGGETNYLFSPTQARRLISNSPTVPKAERQLAAAAHVSPTTDDSTNGDHSVGSLSWVRAGATR